MASACVPLSLYIHIPFCVRKCLYCDFLSVSASDTVKKEYVSALLKEIDFWSERLRGRYQIETVFIGGGTPTSLSPEELCRLGKRLKKLFAETGSRPTEYTIEANPGTLTHFHIKVMQEMGINRVSLGLQSTQDNELKALGRIHTYDDFLESFYLLRENGFENINVDLMADIPEQTLESYRATLDKVAALKPEHISSYSLIIEEGTPFYEMNEKGLLLIPDEETDRKMYELTGKRLEAAGYYRYEISNYAKKGKECRHNQTYWRMGEYLGAGLGAASYFGGFRFSNTDSMQDYINIARNGIWEQALRKNENCYRLKRREEMEEFVFLGLRMSDGISLSDYRKRFLVDFKEVYHNIPDELIKNNLLAESRNHDRIYLTKKGIDVSNMVLARFLLDDERKF